MRELQKEQFSVWRISATLRRFYLWQLRMEGSVKWDPKAYKKLVKVPRIFLKMIISKINEAAEEEGIDAVTPEFLDKVNEKRK